MVSDRPSQNWRLRGRTSSFMFSSTSGNVEAGIGNQNSDGPRAATVIAVTK